ncbi:MAG: hypothetical protein QM786_01405 [Breznakibacter sp.]
MPYRRLPNTDQARLRAMQAALNKAAGKSPADMPFAQKTFLELQAFYPIFLQSVNQYTLTKNKQAVAGKHLLEQFKMARLYVSHFIQVLTFCIQRGELKSASRSLLGLNEHEKSIPDLGTEQQLLEWGEKVIKGEENRMAQGGTRIYNPGIAMVKVKYERFVEAYNSHKDLLTITQRNLDKVAHLREKADNLIVAVWNDVEAKFADLEPERRRNVCTEFGIVYFFRRNEKELVESNE